MRIELFEGFEYAQVEKIMATGTQRVLAPGEVLSESETVDENLCVFLEGKLRIESADGVPLSAVTKVRVLGEMGVLTGQARSSRVVAEDSTTILELTSDALHSLVEEDPEIAQRMLTNLCTVLYGRMHNVNREMEQLRSERDALHQRLNEIAPDDPLLT
jgi:CRP-like cAMP-binding protein